MRILLGIVGVLMFLVGAVGGLAGAGVIADVDTDTSWTCTSYADTSAQTTRQDCSNDTDSDPAGYARQRDLGLAAVIGGAAVFLGGCVLIGGAVAGGGRKQPAASYPPQPVAVGGPPSYGGYQGGGDGSRSS